MMGGVRPAGAIVTCTFTTNKAAYSNRVYIPVGRIYDGMCKIQPIYIAICLCVPFVFCRCDRITQQTVVCFNRGQNIIADCVLVDILIYKHYLA